MADQLSPSEISKMRKLLFIAAGYLLMAPIVLFYATRGIVGVDVSPNKVVLLTFLIGLTGLVLYTGQIPGTKLARAKPHWFWRPNKTSSRADFLPIFAGGVVALVFRYFALEFRLLPRIEAVSYSYCLMGSFTMLTAGISLKDRKDAAR